MYLSRLSRSGSAGRAGQEGARSRSSATAWAARPRLPYPYRPADRLAARRAPKEASCPIPALPRLGSFRDSVNRVTMNGCDLRYLRTGSGRPLCCSTWVRAQLGYFAPLLRHLNTARFAVIAPTYPGTASPERPARSTRPPTSPTP